LTKKAQRRSPTTTETKPLIAPALIGVMVVVAAVAVVGLVWLGNQTRSSDCITVEPGDLSRFPTKGDPAAPVTFIEFSDYG
jgi:hypothetical protein